eukprot:4430709-Pleurochrysis_carterae.AAC.1
MCWAPGASQRSQQLVANALMDVIRRCNHVVLVGFVVQAVEKCAERWRMKLSASSCPVHGRFGRTMNL